MMRGYMDIKARLFDIGDARLRDFNAKLISTVDKDRILGVRTPPLRSLAKEMLAYDGADAFLSELPHEYFEENQLHAFIISEIRDFERAVEELKRFLPYVDNWATCDQMSLRAFENHPDRVRELVCGWIGASHTYTVRFGICTLMKYFLDDSFDSIYLDMVAELRTDEYYINMCAAWFFATALAKQYDATLPYFKDNRLTVWVHNKAIQKARESYRVSAEHKNVLAGLRRKNK